MLGQQSLRAPGLRQGLLTLAAYGDGATVADGTSAASNELDTPSSVRERMLITARSTVPSTSEWNVYRVTCTYHPEDGLRRPKPPDKHHQEVSDHDLRYCVTSHLPPKSPGISRVKRFAVSGTARRPRRRRYCLGDPEARQDIRKPVAVADLSSTSPPDRSTGRLPQRCRVKPRR